MMFTFDALQNSFNAELNNRLSELNLKNPIGLYKPIGYSLKAGGKRLRPVLLLMAYNLFDEEVIRVLPAALSIEIFHNFTLLHDDIMDKSELRRNNPTVHMKYGENAAILSGDAMAFLSYQYLMECQSARFSEILALFTQTALEVCEGQQLDMEFEHRDSVSETEYLEMIRLKTAVLLGCSLKGGALLAEANTAISSQLYDLGINLGLAFQIQDDWLDSFGNSKKFGKRIGGDILAGKQTYLLVKAYEAADESIKLKLRRIFTADDGNEEGKINAVLDVYNQLNIKEIARTKVNDLFSNAETILKQIHLDESRKIMLYELLDQMKKRSH